MASIIVDRGLQITAGRLSNTADSFAALQSISVDDSSTAFTNANTTLGGPGNVVAVNFDSTPTRSAQTVTHVATFGTSQANFTIRRIALHNATAASVTGSSVTLYGGIDGQSITKTADFTVTFTINISQTDVS